VRIVIDDGHLRIQLKRDALLGTPPGKADASSDSDDAPSFVIEGVITFSRHTDY
jgi:hypothetical protein